MVSTLKLLRELNNYTQAFVAETILGISQNTYSRLEASPGRLTAEQAQKLCEFYKVSMAALLSKVKPVIRFEDPGKENAKENELLFLKDELEYFKRQNLELVRLLGERNAES